MRIKKISRSLLLLCKMNNHKYKIETMKRVIIFFYICLGMSTYMFASPDKSDSLKLEMINNSILTEFQEIQTLTSNENYIFSMSNFKKYFAKVNKINKLVNDYYAISNDSSVFACIFYVESITSVVYSANDLIDSAYVHSRRAYQLYEPYGRMICSTDSTKQWPIIFFGDDGIISIMRDWNIKQKKYEEAIRYGTIIIDSCKALNADFEVVKSLLKQGEIYEEIGNYKKSLELRTEALDKRIAYSHFGKSPFASQIYNGIFNTLERLAEKEKLLVNKKTIEWMHSDTEFFTLLNDFIQSHPLDFCKEEENEGETFWAKQLFYSIIRLNKMFNNFNAILSYEDGFGEFIIKGYGRESIEFAEYLMEYSSLYENYSNVVNSDDEKDKYRGLASEKEKLALETWKSFFEKNPINLIVVEYQKQDKEYALQKLKKGETVEEQSRLHGILLSYTQYMFSLCIYYFENKNYDMAYDAVSKAINIKENVLKYNDNAILYSFLGVTSIMRNDLINAEEFLNKSYSLAFEEKDTLNMAQANLELARLYTLNNQSKARQKLSEAYKLVTGYSYHSLEKSEVLIGMADFYKSIYDYVNAYRLFSLSKIEKQYCGLTLTDEDYLKEADYYTWKELVKDSVLFIHICQIADKEVLSQKVQKASEILGVTYTAGLIDLEKGIHYYQKAAHIAHELKDYISEAKNTAEIGTILFLKKKYDEALLYMQKAEKINPRLKYNELLTLMAHVHNDSIVGIRLPFLYESTTTVLKKKMLTTNAEGREMMVRQMPYEVMKSLTYYYPRLPICADVAYNSTLLYKGLLLNTQKTVSEYIASSNDNYLKEQFNKLQIARSKEDQENSTFETSTLSQIEISELEMTILESLSKKKVLADLEITWNKVRDKLSKNDVAIEFIEINKLEPLDRSAICYGALILRSGYKHPVFVVLESKDKIDKDIDIFLNSFRTGSRLATTRWKTVSECLYKNIWGKLENYINPGENVYFSTDGLLHKTPIEFLSDSLGNYANERYNMFRLTSTREICKKKKEGISKAILYGGLFYDAETNGQEVDSLESFQQYDDSSTRSGWKYLPASEVEVDSISSLLSSNGISTIKRKGLDGTEESFKELSGLDLSIVHIATHGFYFPQKEVRYLDYFQSQNNISPMKRSGLMMTGGQTAWMGKKNLDQEHDGILTSEEISKIDLSNVGLVVLSACQTGLGDVDFGAEGVIGIQRAFKLAGAQSLLMSLWKVDDEATSYMMQKFYSRMLSGDTKHNALKTAQKEVRNKYPNPYYWAGFVILD